MNVIESAFENSDTILFDHKKFSNIRTHPKELRALNSKNCCYQIAQNRVKVATDANIFEDKTFFEVPLKNFLLTS